MKTVLANVGEKYLIRWDENKLTPYVVCTSWNGKEWCWGHYFTSVINAAKYFDEVTNPRPLVPAVVIYPEGPEDEEAWDYPVEEIDYLLERAVDEEKELRFIFKEGRLVEMADK